MTIGDVINTSTLKLTFDDEFNSFSASPDGSTGLWRTTAGNGNRTLGSNGEQEFYSDSSVGVNPFSIQNGVLDIRAAPGSNPLGLAYNSGSITTQNSFNQLYGYFEIDAKMPAGQGLWPAFWLLPASGAWPPELDTFEVLGNDPTTLYFSTHSSVQATQGTTLNVADVSAGFNQYGVMWGPSTVDLYINHVEVASMPTPADMNVPMYMLANLAVGGYWPGNPNSSTVFPADMLINYVHAYAYPGTTGGTVYNNLPGANIGPAALPPVISAPANLPATNGIAAALAGVSVAANWPGGSFTVVISDNTGLLNTTDTANVFTSGEGTNTVTLNGNLSAINSALATLTYKGASPGTEWVWIAATDPQGQQSQTSVVVTDTAPGTTPPVVIPPPPSGHPPVVTPTNPPVVTTPAGMTLAAGATQALAGISVASGQTSGNLSVTISDSTGLLKTTAVAGVTERGEGSTALTLTGSLTAINAELASLTYQAGTAVGADWLWVSANDSNGKQGVSHEVVTVAPSGQHTLTAGVGTYTVAANAPGVTLVAGSGTDTLSASNISGTDFYQFGAGAGTTTILNGVSSNSGPSNELNFGSGLSSQDLWLVQSGNDLKIDLMGTHSSVTISGWFSGSSYKQLGEITAAGLKLDAAVSQLVQAMNSYSANHPGFELTAVPTSPSDPALQSAIASAWHH
ncbi:MAG: uncharacterized protein JWM91_642 [Rhodospirillales bacterium]|nr:uncharacterized protein [Rhodospirillales bacterium]